MFTTFDGLLRSFDAETGALKWSRQLGGMFASPPVALQGVTYVGGWGGLYALSETDGTILWLAASASGDHSSPALSDDGVFVSRSCPNVYRINRVTGVLQWTFSTGCTGGGGKTPALYNGPLYVRDSSGYIFDAKTGSVLAQYQPGTMLAFAGNLGYHVRDGTLEAIDAAIGTRVWTFAGDGRLTSAPIVVNHWVFVGSYNGNLYAVAAASGRLVWSTSVGAAIPYPDEHNVVQLAGLSAGEGILAVPAGNLLVVYSQAGAGTPIATPNPSTW